MKFDPSKEDLKSEERVKIVNDIVTELSKLDPNFYYESTSSIARMVYEYIYSGKLNQHKMDPVNGLSVEDIQILLSYR